MPDESIIIPIEIPESAALASLNKVNQAVNVTVAKIEHNLPAITIDANAAPAINKVKILENQFERLKRLAALPNLNTQQLERLNVMLSKTSREIDTFSRTAASVRGPMNTISTSGAAATYSLSNMGRVLQDLPYGIIGVANNITPLIESMVQLSNNAKQTGVSMGKQLLSSLTGGGGLIFGFSILTSVMQFATLGLSAFTRGASGAKSKTEEVKDEIYQFGRVIDETAKELAKSASRVNELYVALNSGKINLDERKSALKELASINKEFFGSLKEENGLIVGLQAAYDGYLLRLKDIGRAKAIQSQLTKLFDKKLELELKIDTKFLGAIDPNLQKHIGDLRKELEQLGGPVDLTKKKFDVGDLAPQFDNATKKVNQFGKAVKDLPPWDANATKQQQATEKVNENLSRRAYLMQRITQLENTGGIKFIPGVLEGTSNEINRIDLQIKALSSLLGDIGEFDIPTPDGSDAEKEMDKIIARARQFVKEFGETFIVPDLDDKFFITKSELYKTAQNLLDNVSKGNLKIKIPTLAIEMPEVNNIDFDPDGSIRKAFLEQMEKELKGKFEVDITVTPDVNIDLSKSQTEELNELVKQFTLLGDRGIRKMIEIQSKDFSSTNDLIKAQIEALQKLQDEYKTAKELAQGVGQSFASIFDAILKGENPIKAFFNSLINELEKLVAKLITTKVAAAFLNLLFPGSGGLGSALGKITGGIANFGSSFGGAGIANRVGFAGGGAGIANISFTSVLRGADIHISGQMGAAQISRAGG
jgi:hypothetical protein